MDPGLADQILEGGKEILGGKSTLATILSSDIRGFTTLTEELGDCFLPERVFHDHGGLHPEGRGYAG